MKRFVLILFAIILLLVNLSFSCYAYTLNDYNVNDDTDNFGHAVVDIRDYVNAKKLYKGGSAFHNGTFLESLRLILIGINELPKEQNSGNTGGNTGNSDGVINSGGTIYLPEAP